MPLIDPLPSLCVHMRAAWHVQNLQIPRGIDASALRELQSFFCNDVLERVVAHLAAQRARRRRCIRCSLAAQRCALPGIACTTSMESILWMDVGFECKLSILEAVKMALGIVH